MKQMWKERLLTWALVTFVLGEVAWLSLTNQNGLQPQEMAHLLVTAHRCFGLAVDKMVHMGMYFAVSLALWVALPKKMRGLYAPFWAFLFATLWGILMEVCQGAITSLGLGARTLDLYDMIANATGALLASVCTTVLMIMKATYAPKRRKAS